MERFYNKTEKQENGCILWIAGSRGKTGYGAFKFKGKVIDAHRMSFIISKGDIPAGFLVCHSCDVRKCVNPDHLFLGTYKENHDDAVSKGRIIKKSRLNNHPGSSTYKHGCRCEKCVIYHRTINTINRRLLRDRNKIKSLLL